MTQIDYKSAGVDAEKADSILEDFVRYQKTRPKNPLVLGGIGPYASCFQLGPVLKDYHDPILVTSCDGVGTKVKLAEEWGKLDGLGQDLVGMNVNDLICVGARPLVFLDYFASSKLDSEQLPTLLKSIQRACEDSHCALVGGETAEMPGVYHGRDFDLAGFVVGIVEKEKILGPGKVNVGDKCLAIESSGFHSNGYSLVRKVVEKKKIQGSDLSIDGKRSWKEALLAPTNLYVDSLLPFLSNLHGLAHITGSGLFGNLPRVLPARTKARIYARDWKFSALFEWIKKEAELSTTQLLSTFNGGVGMVAVSDEATLLSLKETLKQKGLKSWIAGEVVDDKSEEPSVEWVS